MQREYLLEKLSVNKLNPDKAKKQLVSIRKEAEANRTLGVSAKIRGRLKPEIVGEPGGVSNYRYSVKLVLSKEGQRAEEAIDLIEKTVRKAAVLQKWNLVGEAATIEAVRSGAKARPPFELRPLNSEVLSTEFSDIIGRDAHLRKIHAATEMFVESGKNMRSHTILYGEPGAAKTSMFMRLKAFYERESDVERVHALDATAISKAGLENWILDKAEAGELPEILYIEEVEKYDMNVLLPLGSVMDGRGVLTKLNARVDRQAKVSILVWMTCNDEEFVRNWHRGFLWSRCTHKIECVRPTREEMETLILPQKVLQIGGKLEWVKPACDFAYDVLKTDDPREVVGQLDGRDRLLTGEYQHDSLQILKAAAFKKAKKNKKPLDRDEWA
jgi:hypothetical protein